jgi:hypothetical protein
MIYLYANSTNDVAFMPSSSFTTGEEIRAVFTNRYSEVSSSVILTLDMSGDWANSSITLPTDIPLQPGSYNVTFQRIESAVGAVWGVFDDVWSTSDTIWSIGTDYDYFDDTTTTAFVSESISRTLYTSANENAAYVVYNG